MKATLRIFGLIGLFIFGTGLWFTYSIPGFVEDSAKGFIKNRIEQETRQKIESLEFAGKDSKLKQLAGKLLAQNNKQIDKLKNQLLSEFHEKTAAVIAEMGDLDCECRQKYAQLIKSGMQGQIFSLQNANETLLDFMKSKYMEITIKLKTDFRIFTGVNTGIFFFLLIISFLKPQAIKHLFLPGSLLLVSTLICTYFYLFEQNWFYTIIYNNYLGFAYLAYISLIFLFLSDVVFNKGRVTTEIINGLLNAVGSVASIGPC